MWGLRPVATRARLKKDPFAQKFFNVHPGVVQQFNLAHTSKTVGVRGAAPSSTVLISGEVSEVGVNKHADFSSSGR